MNFTTGSLATFLPANLILNDGAFDRKYKGPYKASQNEIPKTTVLLNL